MAAALLAGALAGLAGAVSLGMAMALAGCAGIAGAHLLRSRPRLRWRYLAGALATIAGALAGFAARPRLGPPPEAGPEVVRIEGVVVRAPVSHGVEPGRAGDREQRFVVLTRAPGDRDGPRVEVNLRSAGPTTGPDVRPGDVVAVTGYAAAPRAPGNPGQMDGRALLARRGIGYRVYVNDPGAVRVLGRRRDLGNDVRRVATSGRAALLGRLDRAVRDPADARLLGALLLGERAPLADARLESFRTAGVAHVLAVSGLHVVLLVAAAAWLARKITPPVFATRAAFPALTVTLLAYVALCRFGTPVVRASVFLLVAALGRRAGRRTGTLDHLALAALLVVAVDPAQVRETGFHLSFCAVLGMALLTPRFEEALFPSLRVLERFPEALPRWELGLRRWFARAASASLAAATSTAPIVAATFGSLHPVGPLTNLAVIPLVAVALPLAAVCCIAGGVAPVLTSALAAAVVGTLEGVVTLAGAVPLASLEGLPAPGWAVCASAALLVTAARLRPWTRVHLLLPLAACVVLMAPASGRGPPPGPEVLALDVGHGVSVLVRDGARGTVLADAGGRSPGVGTRRIVPALRALGVERLDALLLSHDDADHCGAAPDVLRAFAVGEVLVPAGFGRGEPARAVIAVCREQGVVLREAARGDRLTAGSLGLTVLHPRRRGVGPAGNQGSLVVHVEFGERGALSALLPGDLEGPPLTALAADRSLPRAEVLILPHHGLGSPGEHLALADRAGSRVLIASAPARAPVRVPGALVTGRLGAVRVRSGPDVEAWPFEPP